METRTTLAAAAIAAHRNEQEKRALAEAAELRDAQANTAHRFMYQLVRVLERGKPDFYRSPVEELRPLLTGRFTKGEGRDTAGWLYQEDGLVFEPSNRADPEVFFPWTCPQCHEQKRGAPVAPLAQIGALLDENREPCWECRHPQPGTRAAGEESAPKERWPNSGEALLEALNAFISDRL